MVPENVQFEKWKGVIERSLSDKDRRKAFSTIQDLKFNGVPIELVEPLSEALPELKELLDKNNTPEGIESFIWDESLVFQKKPFPIGCHKDLFYFGFLLPKTVDFEVKGKKIGKKQIKSPSIITSEGKFFEVTEKLKEDLGIDFNDIPSFLPERWTLKNMHEYLLGRKPPVKVEGIFELITKQYENYLYIRNPTWYKIHALWDIGTYFYEIFEAYPLFELRGIAGTGKSKCMTISSYITFNGGQVMVNPSESTLFRETEEVRGAKYIDEAEKLFVFNKMTKQFEGDVRTELINASYTKGAKVPRQEKIGNRFVTHWYSPYSPCMLGSINGLYGATETRAITRVTTKSNDKDVRGEKEPSEDRNDEVWNDIRNGCYRLALENWREIRDLYYNFPKEIGLKRRDYQIWKPILTLAKFISEEVFEEVVSFAIKVSEQRKADTLPESSFPFMCLQSLKETIESKGSGKIYVQAIKMNYCALKGDEEGTKDIYLNRNISKHLDKLGFNEVRDSDRYGSYFDVNKELFDEVVSPIAPKLVFSSSPSSPSSHLLIKEEKKCGDNVVISDDKKNKSVTMVTICDEGDDSLELKGPVTSNIFTKKDWAKTGLSEKEILNLGGSV